MKDWLVKWRLLGMPQMIPKEMLITVPDEAFELLRRYRDGLCFVDDKQERLTITRWVSRLRYGVEYRKDAFRSPVQGGSLERHTTSDLDEAHALLRHLARKYGI
jgi:hypothetical protein